MTGSTLRLVTPGPLYSAGYVAALERGWSPDSTRGLDGARDALAKFQADSNSVYTLADDPEGAGPDWTAPDGTLRPRLPGRVRWMWDGDDGDPEGFAGTINVRWMKDHAPLPPHVLGHIGYTVVPWKHRRGYATQALALLLPLARAAGMRHAELTTDIDNAASQKVIRANGGVLVEQFTKEAMWGGKQGLRFRIEL